MKTEGYQIRFIDATLSDVLALLEEYSIENKLEISKIREEKGLDALSTSMKKITKGKVELEGDIKECYGVTLSGNPPGKYFTKIPKGRLTLVLFSWGSKTMILFDINLEKAFLYFIYFIVTIFVLPAMLIPTIIMASDVRGSINWSYGVLSFCMFSPSILLLPVIMAFIEHYRAIVGVKRLEPLLWDKLEQNGQRIYSIQENYDSKKEDDLAGTAIIFGLPLAAGFYYFEYTKIAVMLAVFFVLPTVLGSLIKAISRNLPFRYKLGFDRAELSWSWFLAMFTPYILFVDLRNISFLGFFGNSASVFLMFAYILIIFSMPLGFSQEYTIKYRSYFSVPSGGREVADTNKFFKYLFNISCLLYFLLLAAGTVLGGIDLYSTFILSGNGLIEKLNEQIQEFWAFIFPGDLLIIVTPVISLFLLSFSFIPLIATCAVWIKNLAYLLTVDRKGELNSMQILDKLTRNGLYNEIKNTIKVKALIVVVSRIGLSNPYGAAISQRGVIRRSATIYIDPVIFSVVNDCKEREALIWHEAFHAFKSPPLSIIAFEVLFNVWGEQARYALTDSLKEELEADKFSANKMNSNQFMLGALKSLQKAGWGKLPPNRSSLLENLINTYRLSVGEMGILNVHPNLSLRIKSLEES